MELMFCGADREVTGSCHMVESGGRRVLIDCGMFQGRDARDNTVFPFDPKEIDAVVMTHAHIDHSGRLPVLVKQGFKGDIFATQKTGELMGVLLTDAAKSQEQEAAEKRRKNKRAGQETQDPLFTEDDVCEVLSRIKGCGYGREVQAADNIYITFTDVGHLLGSASVTVRAKEGDKEAVLAFSGDVGVPNLPIIRDPQYISQADYAVLESTYGDRVHKTMPFTLKDLEGVIKETISRGGTLLIPAGAIGRTQEMLYHIRGLKENGGLPDFPVYVDSPLASEATKVYDGDLTGYADREALEVLKQGFEPINFDGLKLCETIEESRALNGDRSPKVIIATNGMCEGGRIRHHLKHNLWREECAVLLTGHQANGTLGRALLDGAPEVTLLGDKIAVRAQIHNFRGISAHADKDGLIKWASAFKNKPKRIFLVHGEDKPIASLETALKSNGEHISVPAYGARFDLLTGDFIHEGDVCQNTNRNGGPAYFALLKSQQRLFDLIKANKCVNDDRLKELKAEIDEIIKKIEAKQKDI